MSAKLYHLRAIAGHPSQLTSSESIAQITNSLIQKITVKKHLSY